MAAPDDDPLDAFLTARGKTYPAVNALRASAASRHNEELAKSSPDQFIPTSGYHQLYAGPRKPVPQQQTHLTQLFALEEPPVQQPRAVLDSTLSTHRAGQGLQSPSTMQAKAPLSSSLPGESGNKQPQQQRVQVLAGRGAIAAVQRARPTSVVAGTHASATAAELSAAGHGVAVAEGAGKTLKALASAVPSRKVHSPITAQAAPEAESGSTDEDVLQTYVHTSLTVLKRSPGSLSLASAASSAGAAAPLWPRGYSESQMTHPADLPILAATISDPSAATAFSLGSQPSVGTPALVSMVQQAAAPPPESFMTRKHGLVSAAVVTSAETAGTVAVAEALPPSPGRFTGQEATKKSGTVSPQLLAVRQAASSMQLTPPQRSPGSAGGCSNQPGSTAPAWAASAPPDADLSPLPTPAELLCGYRARATDDWQLDGSEFCKPVCTSATATAAAQAAGAPSKHAAMLDLDFHDLLEPFEVKLQRAVVDAHLLPLTHDPLPASLQHFVTSRYYRLLSWGGAPANVTSALAASQDCSHVAALRAAATAAAALTQLSLEDRARAFLAFAAKSAAVAGAAEAGVGAAGKAGPLQTSVPSASSVQATINEVGSSEAAQEQSDASHSVLASSHPTANTELQMSAGSSSTAVQRLLATALRSPTLAASDAMTDADLAAVMLSLATGRQPHVFVPLDPAPDSYTGGSGMGATGLDRCHDIGGAGSAGGASGQVGRGATLSAFLEDAMANRGSALDTPALAALAQPSTGSTSGLARATSGVARQLDAGINVHGNTAHLRGRRSSCGGDDGEGAGYEFDWGDRLCWRASELLQDWLCTARDELRAGCTSTSA
jgi:hypothetical protein